MKKIAVNTLHYGFNEGAILQAYAVTELINLHLNIPGEIIDQRYPGKVEIYGKAENKRQLALQDAIDNWLPLSGDSFRENSNGKIFEYINNNYSGLIVGSDVVWSLYYQRRFRSIFKEGLFPVQKNPFFPPFPNIYWPGEEIKIPKYSYAASIGSLELSEVPKSDRKEMAQRLWTFEKLGIRDEKTIDFILSIDPQLKSKVSLVPDPTLGIEFLNQEDKNKTKEKLSSLGVDFDRPRLGIVCGDHNPLADSAQHFKKKGFQVIGISTKNSFSDVKLFEEDISPLEWAHLFGHMDLCFTERMHGAIFCLKNKIPFVALDSYQTGSGKISKTESLMRKFGLEDYCYLKEDGNSESLIEAGESILNYYDTDHSARIGNVLNSQFEIAKDFFTGFNLK
jgi:hypothetical protein